MPKHSENLIPSSVLIPTDETTQNNGLIPRGINYILDFEKQLELGEMPRGHTASDRKAHMHTAAIDENRECSETRSKNLISCPQQMQATNTSSNTNEIILLWDFFNHISYFPTNL